jgi:uncharacterized tellurite resistance protein B-like protein
MDLVDLSSEERLALAALIKAAVLADRVVSGDEEERLRDVIDTVGEEPWRRALDEAETRFRDESTLKPFLRSIQRQEARELIYGTVLELAVADSMADGTEADLVDWLADAWNVSAELQPGQDD